MTSQTLKTIASEKSRGSAALEKQWILALQRLSSSGVSDEVFGKLADAASTPSSISRLAKLFSDNPADGVFMLFSNCDASSHGLGQWIDAVDVLYTWLEKHSRHEKFGKCLGYISCAAEGSPDAKLPWVVVQMLDQYGMDK